VIGSPDWARTPLAMITPAAAMIVLRMTTLPLQITRMSTHS
jgi:hypothetical protein